MIFTRLTAVYVCSVANVLGLLVHGVFTKLGYSALLAAVAVDLIRERRATRTPGKTTETARR